jgi:CheY-like chemotaxis protein
LADKTESSVSTENAPAPKPTVLVVEDDPLVRTTVSDYLRDCDYHVIEATDASEAMTVLNTGTHIDIVFSDCELPGSTGGVGLARWIRQNSRHVRLAIVLCSGGRIAAADVSPEIFVKKPYSLDKIVTLFSTLLKKPDENL